VFASVKELDTLGQRFDSLDSTEAATIHTHTYTHRERERESERERVFKRKCDLLFLQFYY